MELLILLLLIVLNGALVLSEMSIVASRKARLQHWSDAGRPGARTALALANEPGHFLSTTQIGITVIGIVSGAFAAETVAKQLAGFLAAITLVQPYADTLALVLVVTGITVCSLVLGELVPKRIALLHPEAIASAIARPMRLLSRLAFPLCKGGLDTIVGVVPAKGLLDDALQGKPFYPGGHAGKPLYIPDGLTITDVLEAFKKNRSHIALVVDEYGEIQGLVTMTDVMEALVGDIDTADESADSDIVRRDDGSWLVDGTVSVQRLREVVGLEAAISAEDSDGYNTVGGFVLAKLRRMPRPGDNFEVAGYQFEVIDMDQNRVDKLLISPVKGSRTSLDQGSTSVR